MSSEQIPILSGAIPAFETFMSKWEKLMKDHSRLRPLVKPGLESAYGYYARMDRTRAYIIAMCKCKFLFETACLRFAVINPFMRMSWIHKHWDHEYITLAETKIKQTVSLSSLQFDLDDLTSSRCKNIV